MSGVIFGADRAGIRKSGLFFNGKRVEFSAKHHRGARAVLEQSDDPDSADVLRYFITETTQATGELRSRLRFMARKLGILVNVQIQLVRVGVDTINFLQCC